MGVSPVGHGLEDTLYAHQPDPPQDEGSHGRGQGHPGGQAAGGHHAAVLDLEGGEEEEGKAPLSCSSGDK